MNESNWTDILQTVAVVAALFFTSWEIRARVREQRLRNYLDAIHGYIDLAKLMIEKPELHALYEYSSEELIKTYEQLSSEEKMRVHYCDTIIALCETVWRANQEGWVSKNEWLYWRRWAHDLYSSREFRWTLRWVEGDYDENFIAALRIHNQPSG